MRYRCQNCSTVNMMNVEEKGAEIACGRCKEMLVVPEDHLAQGVVYGDFSLAEKIVKRSHETDYRAIQLSLKRDVVLKIINQELSKDREFTKSFLDASRLSATLSHPFLCQMIGVGKENGTYYLAREKGGERSLRSLLVDDGILPWAKAARMICDLAKALDYAWDIAGVTHMNVKPDYVMVCDNDHARLADIGLAGLNPEPGSEKIVGTPQYISPERIVGMDGDNRSDLYSLGVTLFFTITGQFPHDAKNSSEFIDHHLNHPPRRPDSIIPDLPATICDVISVLLDKNPNLRYQKGAVLVSDLEAIFAGGVPPFAVQALQAQGIETSAGSLTVDLGGDVPAVAKTAIAKDDDASPIGLSSSSPTGDQFDDLDNLFDDLEKELDKETKTMKPSFAMATDEFEAIVEGLDYDAPAPGTVPAIPLDDDDDDDDVPLVVPIAQVVPDDDVPLVVPIAQAAPPPPSTSTAPATEDHEELAAEVDALFDEPAAAKPVAATPGVSRKKGTAFPAMSKTRTGMKPPKVSSGDDAPRAKKKKKFNTRVGSKTKFNMRKK